MPVEEPRYDPDEVLGVTSFDVRKPFDVKEVIARVVDGSRFHEFKPTYGTTLVTGAPADVRIGDLVMATVTDSEGVDLIAAMTGGPR